jgi:protein TonB
MVGVAEVDRVEPTLGSFRLTGLAISFAGHALALAVVVVLTWHVVMPPPPAEPVRLVFVEPPPPPRKGSPGGSEDAARMRQQIEPIAPASQPQPAPVVRQPEPKPAGRSLERRVTPSPRREIVARTKPPEPTAPAPPAPSVPDDAAVTAAVAPPRGVADGSEAGVRGGLSGGRVGGLGSDLVPASRAAVPPAILRSVMPVYPERARIRGIEGEVLIEAVITTDGTVEPEIRIVRSIPELDQAAIDAFRRWHFRPARDNQGRPLRVLLQAPVRFVLR